MENVTERRGTRAEVREISNKRIELATNVLNALNTSYIALNTRAATLSFEDDSCCEVKCLKCDIQSTERHIMQVQDFLISKVVCW